MPSYVISTLFLVCDFLHARLTVSFLSFQLAYTFILLFFLQKKEEDMNIICIQTNPNQSIRGQPLAICSLVAMEFRSR